MEGARGGEDVLGVGKPAGVLGRYAGIAGGASSVTGATETESGIIAWGVDTEDSEVSMARKEIVASINQRIMAGEPRVSKNQVTWRIKTGNVEFH
jgi:hypothetical protein